MQIFTGMVISAKQPRTVTVAVEQFRRHPKYHKIMRRTRKILVHNTLPEIKEGDKVKIGQCRPYSKRKHFKVTEVLK